MRRILAGIAATAMLSMAACSNGAGEPPAAEPEPPAEEQPQALTVTGTITTSPGFSMRSDEDEIGDACRIAPKGPHDLDVGKQVKVTDASGTTLALGAFSEATVVEKSNSGHVSLCEFPFEVGNVPAEHDFYKLVVGQRPAYDLARADLDSPVELVIP